MELIIYSNLEEDALNYFYDKGIEYLVKIFINKMTNDNVLRCLKNKIKNAYSYNFLVKNSIIQIKNICITENLLSLKYFLENPKKYNIYRFNGWFNGIITHYFFHSFENNENFIHFFQDDKFEYYGEYLFKYSKYINIIEYLLPFILDNTPLTFVTNYCSRNIDFLVFDITKTFKCNFIKII